MNRSEGNRRPMLPLDRRQLMRGAGAMVVAVPFSAAAQDAATAGGAGGERDMSAWPPDLTGTVARYMAAAPDRALPEPVVAAAKDRILDTIAAMISGTTLPPAVAARAFAWTQLGKSEASVLASGMRTTATHAAFANAMFAHSDETDDFDPVTKAHPGCSVVPAALAMAEVKKASGAEMIRAVTLGYDLCCRLLLALDPVHVRARHRSAEATGATIGATAAAAAIARFDETRMRHSLSYAGQQTSGLWSWKRDVDHIEKAFDFSGMGARNGVSTVAMIEQGFTGVADVLDGRENLLTALSVDPQPMAMIDRLGERFSVTETAIKRFSVGYPIQAPLDALLTLRARHALTPEKLSHMQVRLPTDGARIVNVSAMADVNLQYLMAVALIDGTMSFAASHSHDRVRDPRVQALMKRIELVADDRLVDPAAPRSGHVFVTTQSGATYDHFTRFPPGTMENPLSAQDIRNKARELIEPVIGTARTSAVIEAVSKLEDAPDCSALTAPLTDRATVT